jgi:hypothetical protein
VPFIPNKGHCENKVLLSIIPVSRKHHPPANSRRFLGAGKSQSPGKRNQAERRWDVFISDLVHFGKKGLPPGGVKKFKLSEGASPSF